MSQAPRFTRVQKNEFELRERLCNLLEELEPWKEKLTQAIKRSVQRLKKEWDEYDPKSEEIAVIIDFFRHLVYHR